MEGPSPFGTTLFSRLWHAPALVAGLLAKRLPSLNIVRIPLFHPNRASTYHFTRPSSEHFSFHRDILLTLSANFPNPRKLTPWYTRPNPGLSCYFTLSPIFLYRMSDSWSYSLLDCCRPMGLCCLGSWCPCIFYGRIQSRLRGEEKSSCSGSCVGYLAFSLCGIQPYLQGINHRKIREHFGIKGNVCGDICGAYCCTSCQLVQAEKEFIKRSEDGSQSQGYLQNTSMVYK